MSKFDLAVYVFIPIISGLGVYGMFIAARLKNAGWDIKGLLMLLCLVLPGLGIIIALIVRSVRNRRLKKAELKDQQSSGIPATVKPSHSWYYISRKEFKIIVLSFVIGVAAYLFVILVTISNMKKFAREYDMKHGLDSFMHSDSMMEVFRRDSINHERRMDSLEGLELKKADQ